MLTLLVPPDILLTLGVMLVGFCLLLGARRTARAVLAATLLAVMLLPLLRALFAAVPPPILIAALIVIAPFLAIAGIGRLVDTVYGRDTAGHVTATLLLRLLDLLGRTLWLPVRLLRRRRWRRHDPKAPKYHKDLPPSA